MPFGTANNGPCTVKLCAEAAISGYEKTGRDMDVSAPVRKYAGKTFYLGVSNRWHRFRHAIAGRRRQNPTRNKKIVLDAGKFVVQSCGKCGKADATATGPSKAPPAPFITVRSEFQRKEAATDPNRHLCFINRTKCRKRNVILGPPYAVKEAAFPVVSATGSDG
jgi:hypothetical protein